MQRYDTACFQTDSLGTMLDLLYHCGHVKENLQPNTMLSSVSKKLMKTLHRKLFQSQKQIEVQLLSPCAAATEAPGPRACALQQEKPRQ